MSDKFQEVEFNYPFKALLLWVGGKGNGIFSYVPSPFLQYKQVFYGAK